ncbi:MAG TPA: glycerate kinase [Patescibacteria group bacterium]|nr:glycerate kinase [Patescibacteria group bacterium]
MTRAAAADMSDPRTLLESMFRAAIASAQPSLCLPPFLPPRPKGRLVVLGAGKASAAMARAVEDNWDGPLTGLVITRQGYEVPCLQVEIVRAAHPVPDAAGEAAATRMMALAHSLGPDDLALCLISGGGSALMPLPMAGLTLDEKQRINRLLLACGATISEINCVRRHISRIKGGRLAAAAFPAKVITLLISDVPGDHPGDIASGPTIGDATTVSDAADILRRYDITLHSPLSESVKPDDPRLANNDVQVIATPGKALAAAARLASEAGVPVRILGDDLEGEARELGAAHARLALETPRPCILLSGGETTVAVRGNGRGGRNVEYLLSLALHLQGAPHVYAVAGDTDGVDGMEDIAGARVAPDTLARARQAGLDPVAALANNDAHTVFQRLADSIITGPTFTNVNDFRAIYVGKA